MKNYEQIKKEFYDKVQNLKDGLIEIRAKGSVKTDQRIEEIKSDLYQLEIKLQQLPDATKVKWDLFKKEIGEKIDHLKKEMENLRK